MRQITKFDFTRDTNTEAKANDVARYARPIRHHALKREVTPAFGLYIKNILLENQQSL